MKRHRSLHPAICSFPNLLEAMNKALRGKRRKPLPAGFLLDAETELVALQDELTAGTYVPGPYREFQVRDPKCRWISAAPFRDRVVHHAVCNVLEPIFEPTFIFDSYACRKGKGTHAAADRATRFARCSRYVLHCDISDYFASIDHELLLAEVCRKIACPRTLELLGTILAAGGGRRSRPVCLAGDDLFSASERARGLPLGNQTSQFLANVYLSPIDHFVKDLLGVRRYVRYVDDLLLFGDDKGYLWGGHDRLCRELTRRRLQLNPRKTFLSPVEVGFPFMGYRIFPDHRRLRAESGRRFRRRLHDLARGYALGEVELAGVRSSVNGWLGHVSHADTWGCVGPFWEGSF